MIHCSEIDDKINELKIKAGMCSHVPADIMVEALNLMAAMRNCFDSGGQYNKSYTEQFITEGEERTVVYPIDKFHSISVVVLEGAITYSGVRFPKGTVRNVEFSSLNKTEFSFIVNKASSVFVEYITNL